jgi:hypothetical protein
MGGLPPYFVKTIPKGRGKFPTSPFALKILPARDTEAAEADKSRAGVVTDRLEPGKGYHSVGSEIAGGVSGFYKLMVRLGEKTKIASARPHRLRIVGSQTMAVIHAPSTLTSARLVDRFEGLFED